MSKRSENKSSTNKPSRSSRSSKNSRNTTNTTNTRPSKSSSKPKVEEVNSSNFHKIASVEEYDRLKNKGLVIVDYFTTWCGPCKAFAPVFEEISKKYPDVTFLSVNAESIEHDDCASIKSVPTFRVFLNGKQKREFSGIDRARLERYIERYEIQILFNGRVQRSFPKEVRDKINRYLDMLSGENKVVDAEIEDNEADDEKDNENDQDIDDEEEDENVENEEEENEENQNEN